MALSLLLSLSHEFFGSGLDASTVAEFALGVSRISLAIGLAYLGRQFPDPRAQRAYLPFAALLACAGLAHSLHALGFLDNRNVVKALPIVTVVCAVGAVILLRDVVVRAAALGRRERDGQRREGELTAVFDELSTEYSRLQDMAELKTQVFANVSHELRTPLTLILGPVQALREATELSQEQRASLTVVERNANLLLGHVNDLLELSRADAVGVKSNQKPTDVLALFNSMALSFRPLAVDLGVEYEVDLRGPLDWRLLDAQKLERIAMNLLANAFKFTPRGGKVALRARVNEVLPTIDGGPELLLSVDDSGPGIRMDDRELVFERFRQLDGKPNRAFSGTGLGLSIVREFVVASRGSVRIEDSALGGARFIVRLPAQPCDGSLDSDPDSFPQSASSAEMLALRPSPSRTYDPGDLLDLPLVLVVEDNPDMNRFVCSSLSTEFRVTSALDGQQALARLEGLTPDLIVTDFMMPRMSGDEFVRALRSNPVWSDIPVLVLTARDDVELRARALSDGVQDWLAKPFTVRELTARARNLTSARRARTILRTELATSEFDVGALADQLAERKRQLESLLESLTQALEQAEIASRFKTSLLRLVSHELRTPLAALQLQLERLSSEHRGPLNEPQQQLILRMKRSLARLTDTIQSLLEYARIESGRLDLFVETFDLRELARSVVDDFGGQAESKGLKLQLVATEGVLNFESDARLVRLVLVNLIANALKFTAQGEVTVSVELRGDRFEMRVRDTGPGIEPSMRFTVFEPFIQGESADHQQYSQGAGLGLSLVREMLHALGGRIELESELGKGSTFSISVPRAKLAEVSGGTPELERNIA
ncbi:MAG: ATP-binding protein [Polyangiaceae bacterium]